MNKNKERIAKRLSRAGLCSRREAERWILSGRVSLDGYKVSSPATLVTEKSDIRVDGKKVKKSPETRVWRYHKPRGLLCTNRDPQGRTTIFENFPDSLPRVISIGRLDYSTEGLLLLTNDGELARKLEHPKNAWVRRYRVRLFGKPTKKEISALRSGLAIDGTNFGSIEVSIDSVNGANSWLTASLSEGKNRAIRRVFEFLGHPVSRLIRIAYGPFQLDNLNRGSLEEISKSILVDQLELNTLDANNRRYI
tara:strand:+ start:709 stop:1461 length:753 start_codon:yes stop_codon:yes gene_type:complete